MSVFQTFIMYYDSLPHSHMGMYIYTAVSTKEWSVVTTRDTLSPLLYFINENSTELTETLG